MEGARARLEGVAALASSIQPAGSTLATADKVLTRVRQPACAPVRSSAHSGFPALLLAAHSS